MYDGKRGVAAKIVYDAIEKIKSKSKDEPINVFNEAINNIKPTVEVRSRRVGGATYQVPVEVKSKRAQALAIRWLVESARKRKAPVRKVYPDPKFHSEVVSKFINSIMYDGKRSTAEKILYDALDKIKSKNNEDPLKIFNTAISNVKPNLECRSRRVGGATYQVPVEVKSKRAQALALRWLMDATRKRKNKTMAEKLYAEILDASQNKGSAIKKREDVHKMAESNKAFAHFRW